MNETPIIDLICYVVVLGGLAAVFLVFWAVGCWVASWFREPESRIEKLEKSHGLDKWLDT